MAYLDLNPVRAKMADTSDHTSIKKRIECVKQAHAQPHPLALFVGNPREPMPKGLPFELKDYIQLVDHTGRAIRDDKRGYIDKCLAPILTRLDINEKEWLILTTQFERRFGNMVGKVESVKHAAECFGYQRRPGLANCQALLH